MKATDFWHAMVALYLDNADATDLPVALALKAKGFADAMLQHARDSGTITSSAAASVRPRLRVPWGGVVLPASVHGVALDRDGRLIVQIGERSYLRSPTPTLEAHGFGEQLIEAAQLHKLKQWGNAGVRLGRVTVAFADRGQAVVELRGGGYLRSPTIGEELAQQSISELERAMADAGLAR